MSAPERKYALTKVAAGDYLLPSNDAKAIWRISKYQDGPSSGITDWPCDRTVWGIWRWESPVEILAGYVDVEDWSRWDFFAGTYELRSDAIDAALASA